MADNLVRRRGTEELAVHRDVDGGAAELVPDLSRPGSWLLFLDGVPQSQVDLEDPGYLEFEYVRRIGHVIDLAFPGGEPLRALHLGGGALTLPRYIAHTRPGSSQLVAELDAPLTDLVREHLPLPDSGKGRVPGGKRGRIRVRAGDAREVLESVRPGSFDLIISDVFAGARTPFHLTTAECAQAMTRALRPGGIWVRNVADAAPLKGVRGAVATGRSVNRALPTRGDGSSSRHGGAPAPHTPWPPEPPAMCLIAEPAVLRGRRLGNFVLVAGDRSLPVDGLARRTAADPFPARVVDGDELTRFAGSAPVITDASESNSSDPRPTTW